MTTSPHAAFVTRGFYGVLATLTLLASGRGGAAGFQQAVETPTSQLVTLYAHDDLLSSYSFRKGAAGARVVAGEIDLTDAQIVFHALEENLLSFGFVGMEAVNIIDLGDVLIGGVSRARDRAPKFAPSLFHTLFLDGVKFSYISPGDKTRRYAPAQRILDPLPSEGLRHVQPVVGHVYLMRGQRSGVGVPEEIVKFQIVDLRPGHSLTLRWAPVRRR